MDPLSVKDVNKYISRMFQGDQLLSKVSVCGEISNCKYHSTGHVYFSLKDDESVIDCILFSSYKRYLDFTLENGMKVVVHGSIDTYIKTGKYSINVRKVENEGAGSIVLRLAEMKEKFRELGMFDEQYKKPLPKYPKKIGIVTSPTGAAIWDVIETARGRDPYVSIILYPAIVQGDRAKESISRGIETLEEYGVDVIVIGRGGGSLEELWAFNEEMVAYAIFNCSVPVISAVGHETDLMVSDLVADLRVSTPTQAMMYAVAEISDVDDQMEFYQNQLERCMADICQKERLKTERLKGKLEQASPKAKLIEYRNRVQNGRNRLEQGMNRLTEKSRQKIMIFKERIKKVSLTSEPRHMLSLYTERMKKVDLTAKSRYRLNLYSERMRKVRLTDEPRHKLKLYVERMKQANPLERLNQGLAYVSDDSDKRISSVSELNQGQTLHIRLRDGNIKSKIEEIIPIKEEA